MVLLVVVDLEYLNKFKLDYKRLKFLLNLY